MRKSTFTYKHGISSYPKKWRDFLVSAQKICIQFDEVQLKTRVKDRDYSQVDRVLNGHSMPIHTHGTDVEFLAVGVPINLYPEMLMKILEAVKEHDKKFPEHSIKDFMLEYSDKIKEELNGK